jgi:hypothetical protein
MKVKIISKNIKKMMTLIASFCKRRIRFKNSVKVAHIMVDLNIINLCRHTDKIKLINYLELKTFKGSKLIKSKIILKVILSLKSKIKYFLPKEINTIQLMQKSIKPLQLMIL